MTKHFPLRASRFLAVLALGAATGLPVCAQSGEGLQAPHAYAGVSAGKPDWQANNFGSVLDGSNGGAGYKLYGGYAITPNFGVELGWVWLGRLSGNGADAKADGPFLDAVATLPVNPKWSVLGRLGVANERVRLPEGSERGTDVTGGLGVQYNLSSTMGIRAEWERYGLKAFGEKPKVDLYSVGLNVAF